ncbi:MAG TPA: type II toxin-antitoxin system RelE/ParE family toxin [Candidatus Krumholzibacteria bacterium]|nr:type II toxin-antitoxin system RelE/ParE family toxin [Candidatus Krumholzibacteria bacterium]
MVLRGEGGWVAIASFGDKATEQLYHGGPTRFPANVVTVARRKLDMLHAAHSLRDMASPPGNRLEALKGDLVGWFSIRVNRQWRIIFRWRDTDAYDVRLVDYH